MKKRVFAFLLTIAIVVSACGCQSNQTAETADQLSVFALKNVYVEDINTNEFTKYYEEQSGIHVNWEIASGDASQAFNLKIASGQYPDIFYGFPIGPAEQKLYAKSGILIDLTDYIDKYAPNIKKMFEEKPVIIPGFKMKAVHIASKLLPSSITSEFAYEIQRRKRK